MSPTTSFAVATHACSFVGVSQRRLVCDVRQRRTYSRPTITMQKPPINWKEPPLSDIQKGPEGYIWDEDFPGTLKPGIGKDDCYPMEEIMNSGVYERMVFDVMDMYERPRQIFKPNEDILTMLAEMGRLIPKDASDMEIDVDPEKQLAGVTEEDLEYGDEDEKMLAYYTKQGEGSALGASSDFGGMAESGFEGSLEQSS